MFTGIFRDHCEHVRKRRTLRYLRQFFRRPIGYISNQVFDFVNPFGYWFALRPVSRCNLLTNAFLVDVVLFETSSKRVFIGVEFLPFVQDFIGVN
ncbi:hypothetical protein C486_10674 [Natrinema gari JCM 14663]|uniref:Uncharacterized protein n=1 Tax=Natrinema gari JCM 14663 TaxID=1230459 RepID=L9Z2S3_9EURY|nr:hypothetical protein C486_10674 [Natrinema gari JCM 14663]